LILTPNYNKLLQDHPDFRREVTTDKGAIPAFYCAQNAKEPAWSGPIIRIDWLKEQGMVVDAKDHNGRTPMYCAAVWGSVTAMKWLYEQGADINAKDNQGNTPLGAGKKSSAAASRDSIVWLRSIGAVE